MAKGAGVVAGRGPGDRVARVQRAEGPDTAHGVPAGGGRRGGGGVVRVGARAGVAVGEGAVDPIEAGGAGVRADCLAAGVRHAGRHKGEVDERGGHGRLLVDTVAEAGEDGGRERGVYGEEGEQRGGGEVGEDVEDEFCWKSQKRWESVRHDGQLGRNSAV